MIELPASMAEVTPDWPQRALGEHPALAGSARRRNNFVFNRTAAVRLVMFDWQLVARMLPGVDFAHFFFGTSLTYTGRTRLVPSLTQRYLDALQRNDVRDYNADAFAHVFCLGTRAMTMIAVIARDSTSPPALSPGG